MLHKKALQRLLQGFFYAESKSSELCTFPDKD